MGSDANSLQEDPYYVSDEDLRVGQAQLNGAATFAGVYTDIENNIRNMSAPDIGASEFTIDFGVLDLLQPTQECFHTDSEQIEVRIVQYGDAAMVDKQIAYQLNDGPVVTETIPGTYISDVDYTFTSTEDLSAFGSYEFKIWLVSSADENVFNDTLYRTINRTTAPVADFTFTTSCANEPVSFTGTASSSTSNISAYQWIFGDGDSSTVQNPSHVFDVSGTYDVKFRAYVEEGCYAEYEQSVSVNVTPLTDFSVSNYCLTDATSFTNHTTVNSGSLTYQWDFGDGNTAIETDPTNSYLSAGNYTVSLITTAQESSCKDTLVKDIVINPSYSDTTTIIGNSSVDYNGVTYTTSQQITISYNTLLGCDSLTVIDIVVASSEMTNVPDNNFEAYLETHDANGNEVSVGDSTSMGDGILGNNLISTLNVSTVRRLVVSDLEIATLEGIQSFTSLNTLICKNNLLTELDISQNLALKELNCRYNQISSLEVSQNTGLTSLICNDNVLTSLDVSNNTLLEHLGCEDNELTSIDIINNTALTYFICGDNQISSLDVSQNTALTYLGCHANLLTELDVSNNTALTVLSFGENQITSIDVSNLTALTKFWCYSNALTCVNLKNGNNNNITSFDARYNPDLDCIEVDDPAWSEANWTYPNLNVDNGVTFSVSCSYPAGCF